jgi:phage terminase large subunit-like protein
LIEAPAGRAIDRLAIVRRIAEIAASFDLQGIAFDRWRLEDLKKLLADEGIDIPVTPWGKDSKTRARRSTRLRPPSSTASSSTGHTRC